jgi:hypothetical protein
VVRSADFLRAVVAEFPQLGDLIDPNSGLIHQDLAQFVAFTQEAIDRHDLPTVRRCVGLVAESFDVAEPELRNAFHVTFLEELSFPADQRYSAETLLGEKLYAARSKVLDYLERLLGKPVRK